MNDEIRAIIFKYSDIPFSDFMHMGERIVECLKELNELGYAVTSFKISVNDPYVEIEYFRIVNRHPSKEKNNLKRMMSFKNENLFEL